MFPIILFSLGMFTSFIGTTVGGNVTVSKYTDFKSFNIQLRMSAIEETVFEPSVISCGLRCFNCVRQCNSFIYDTSSRSCTTGSLLSSMEAFSSTPGEQFFIKGIYCDNSVVNFTLRSYADTSICMFIPSESTNYDSARQACVALGATLYTAKVWAKLNILLDVLKDDPAPFWIGLDDIKVEGEFRWVDDNSVLKLWSLFAPGQPNNYLNQDCICYATEIRGLNDRSCTDVIRYICEKIPLIV
ncbi:uncharacterized protein LOC106062573 [Biomphalaria glabrata]|uniref:Uncharacterized protein LOC106062573 n=1 Tax=Biomphalaria glabrata TaxID=6526 RepID=A0A9W2YEH5_BIOGL|nr:uncharacterized protein LOC106062573 [Biomphalaria glabrata]XP_055861041.1 uncharacterized protein LOC106062573 [Biomphalaria glabrata]